MKETTILIKGKPFTYQDESLDITYDNTGVITENEARNLMIKAQKLFSEIGVDIYLAFGTLLGAVREGGLIKWDSDVDVYVDDEEQMYENLQYLQDHGLKLCRMFRHECYSFKVDVGSTAYIDVYIRRPCKWYSIWGPKNCWFHKNVTPKKLFAEGSQEINFLGVKCKCVKNPENLLAFWYGENWRTPIQGHGDFMYEIPIAHFIHKFPKRFLKFIIAYKYWKPFVKPDGKNWWFLKK